MSQIVDSTLNEQSYCGFSEDRVIKTSIFIDLVILLIIMIDMPEPLVLVAIVLAAADFLVFVAFANETPRLILPFFVGRGFTLIFGAVAILYFTYAAICMPIWWLEVFIRTTDAKELMEFKYIAQLMTAFIALLLIGYEWFQYFTLKVVYQAYQQLRQKALIVSSDVEPSS